MEIEMVDNNSDCVVYKIVTRAQWDEACLEGIFHGSSDDRRDGFIHLSKGGQLATTAQKYFSGQSGLVLVAFHAGTLGDTLKWEVSRGGALFPHLYGPLVTKKVLWLRELPLARDGTPIIPGDAT